MLVVAVNVKYIIIPLKKIFKHSTKYGKPVFIYFFQVLSIYIRGTYLLNLHVKKSGVKID